MNNNLINFRSTILGLICIFSVYAMASTSCTPKSIIPDWISDTPTLFLVDMEDSIFRFNDVEQRFIINLKVFDKDKNLGNYDSDTSIIINDYRNDTLFGKYRLGFPKVDHSLVGEHYLEAGVKLFIPAGGLRPRSDAHHVAVRKDTAQLRISIIDEDSNVSNEVMTGNIYIQE